MAPRFLLLQIRDAVDPVRHQEVDCFLRSLNCQRDQLEIHSLLQGPPSLAVQQRAQVILIGGSGRYSAIGESEWLLRTLDLLRDLHHRSRPVFASCWGFQAMARALGGSVQRDPQRAELGTLPVRLTAEGVRDPLFGPLGRNFPAHMGHEDSVIRLPEDALSLAYSDRSDHQAFCFPGRPIYCTQFHPELDRTSLLDRVQAYPEYIERIAGIPLTVFAQRCVETVEANRLIERFAQHVLSSTR